MSKYLLDEHALDSALIRRWAYDPNAEFMEQDEDLLLHDWELAELIFELASDPDCPKAEYVLSIWHDFTRHNTVHQESSDLLAADRALSLAEQFKDHAGIALWAADQASRLEYVKGKGTIDRTAAMQMGDFLLNGRGRQCQISILRENADAFLVQLSVPHSSHKEWLLIIKETGKFRFSRWWPRGAKEPIWFEPKT